MNRYVAVFRPRLIAAVLAWLLAGVVTAKAADSVDGIISVSSKVSTDYVRARAADGTLMPETYAFGEGGHWTSGTDDATIDKLKFMDVATQMAAPLANQHYFPTRDAKTTKLVIMVYWGSTQAHFEDSEAMQNLQSASSKLSGEKSLLKQEQIAANSGNGPPSKVTAIQMAQVGDADNALSGAMATATAASRSRDETDNQMAVLLGYDSAWADSARFIGTAQDYRRQDLSSELEEGRYFVVLMAYDFQLMLKEKKHKLLWETRFSISQRRNAFDSALPKMTDYASQFFGQDTNGLLRKKIPLGNVEVGPVKSLGETEAPSK